MDDKHNYHTLEKDYLAIRLPKVTGSNQLQKKVREEEISATEVFERERECLAALRRFDRNKASVEEVLDQIREYELLFNGRDQTDRYRELLEDRPWKHCDCAVCQNLGIDVTFLRGKERNKRRGFHNMRVLFKKVAHALQRS
jgi:chromosomal replication initiation ATPase DnaA